MHLSDQSLQRLLRSADQDLLTVPAADHDPTPDEFTHLESCEACRQRLATLSGEADWFAGISSELIDLHRSASATSPSMPDSAEWGAVVGPRANTEPGQSKAGPAVLNGRAGEWTDPWDLTHDLADEAWSGGRSGRITISIGGGDDGDSESESRESAPAGIRTDFLPPGAHPELLGRLGRYDIEETLGAGGFGIVFKAYDTELRRVVALKVLAPHLMSSGAARKRFAREAQAAAAIMHEHVIPIYDVVSQGEACYLVMQYIAGQSLQERVDRGGPLGIAEVLRIGSQIAAGLQAAHEQGLVHRDVKPANILLEESVDRVLISDFGLARTADDANLTRSGAITGTPHYMSPEQASGALVDPRSDLFSLGSVLYFALTGRPAFRAPQIVAVLNRICHFPHRRVSEVNPDVPAPVADLIDRLLAKDPEARVGSAEEVERALRQLLADWQSGQMAARLTAAPTSPPLGPPATAGVRTPASASPGPTARRSASRSWPGLWVAAAAIGCCGLWLAPTFLPQGTDPAASSGSNDALADSNHAELRLPGTDLQPSGDSQAAESSGSASVEGGTAHLSGLVAVTGNRDHRPERSIASEGTVGWSFEPVTKPARSGLAPREGLSTVRQIEVLQLHWDSDSQPLQWQMEALHQAWLQEDLALEILLKSLQEITPQATVDQ